jgi:hypothetical protein
MHAGSRVSARRNQFLKSVTSSLSSRTGIFAGRAILRGNSFLFKSAGGCVALRTMRCWVQRFCGARVILSSIEITHDPQGADL